MISLKLAAGFLKLYPGTVVELIKNNPLLAEDGAIPGTYAITIEVPNDEEGHNARILGAVNMVENFDILINSEQEAVLYFDGVPLEAGKVIIKPGNSEQKFNLNFVGGLRAVSRDFKDKKLTAMSWPEVNIHFQDFGTGSAAQVATKALMQAATDAAILAIDAARQAGHFHLHRYKNVGFSSDPDFTGFVNEVNSTNQQPNANGIHVSKQFKYQASVQVSPNGGLEYVTGQISMTVNGTAYTSTVASTSLMEKYKELASVINAAENGTGITLQAVVDGLNFYINPQGNVAQNGENGHMLIEVINEVDQAADLSGFTTIEADTDWLETEDTAETRYSNRYYYAPTFKVSQVFEKIEQDYGVKFTGAIFEDPDLLELAFHTNTSLMVPVTIADSTIEGDFYAFKSSFNAGDYMPDWTVGQWIREVAFLFSCGVVYDQYTKLIRFVYLNDVVRASGYYDAASEGIRFQKGQPDTNAYSGITFKYAEPSFPQTSLTNLDQVVLGSGERTLQSNFRVFSIYLDEEKDIKKSPVIMFDRGQSNGQFIATETCLSGTYSLQLTGYLGNELYETFHSAWFSFLMTRKTLPVTALMQLRHVNLVDFTQKVQFDRVRYLYASIKIRLTMRGLAPTQLTMHSL